MSWDVSVFAAETPPPPVAEMHADWVGLPLGTHAELRAKISQVLPQVDWSDPLWGIYHRDEVLEFNLGADDPALSFMVHVRGGGDPVSLLIGLVERWGWYLLDTSTMEWLHHSEAPDAGWAAFRGYRDRVLRR